MRAAVTFIIPTSAAGTERRGRALRSLLAQSDPDWLAVAIGAGEAPYLPLEARYFTLRGPADGGVPALLNSAFMHLHLAARVGEIDTEWVAVLDDHDTVSEQFVARCKDIGDAADVIIFRTQTTLDVVLPNREYPALVPGEVGSAVVVRRAFADRAHLDFEPVDDPMSHLLRQAFVSGARVLLHPSINYFEKDHRPRA